MLPNAIVLTVDEDNSGSGTVDYAYSRHDDFQNRSLYIRSDHSLASRRILGFYRTPPKVSGNSNGVAKCSLKITEDATIPGVNSETTLKMPIIGEVSFALPVGVTNAQATALRQALVALLDRDDIMDPFVDQQQI